MSSPIIVALDYQDEETAMPLIHQLEPSLCALKVGSELFTKAGPKFIEQLVAKQFKVFLDLKFHDIPNTVAKACQSAASLGVWMLNVHASGGVAMMSAAREAIDKSATKPLLIAVTVLTSFAQDALIEIGINSSLKDQVLHLAGLAKQAHCDGIVCSALETQLIKETFGQTFKTITPGIRLPEDLTHDQVRITTPNDAMQQGSDYLVIGRSITQVKNPKAKLTEILSTII